MTKTRRIPRKPPTKQERAMMKQIQALPLMSGQEARVIVDRVLERVGIGKFRDKVIDLDTKEINS
jgi:hypothetical protein